MKNLILLFVLSTLNLFSCTNYTEREQSVYQISETVELALVIAALSDLDRASNNSIDRRSAYYNRVETFFKVSEDHEVFELLGSDFNLPRLAGNASDYAFNESGMLVLVDSTGSLWKDDTNNYFRNYLAEIQDFSDDTNFREFYEQETAFYNELININAEASNLKSASDWLNNLFDSPNGTVQLNISPLMSGFHWTTLYKPEQRIWVNPYYTNNSDSLSSIEKMEITRAMFTELDHGYVNPISANYQNQLNDTELDLTKWGLESAIMAYNTGELVFNEYMTWGIFLLYAEEHMDSNDYEEYHKQIVEFMNEGRGFNQFDLFVEKLDNEYESVKSGEILTKRMVDWFHSSSVN